MCVIIANPQAKRLPDAIVLKAMNVNPDGFGIIYLDDDSAPIKTMDYNEAYEHLQSGRPYIAHLRYTTRGATTLENCHPFKSGDDGWLFHNGTVSIETSKNQVDSDAIATLVGDMDEDTRRAVLELTDSRFVRVDSTSYEIYNESMWTEFDGVLYSKSNVLVAGDVVGVYGTLRKGYGNHRLLATAPFLGEGATADKYRMTARGIPFMLQGANAEGGHNVVLETYAVSNMKAMDSLEGHPTFYKREQIPVAVYVNSPDGGSLIEVDAWVYIINDVQSYDDGVYYEDYADVVAPKVYTTYKGRSAYGYSNSYGYSNPYGSKYGKQTRLTYKGKDWNDDSAF